MRFGALALASAVAISAAACAQTSDGELIPDERVYIEREHGPLRVYVFALDADESLRPAVLLFHGGGWAFGEAAWTFGTAKRLAGRGAVAISVEYRLSNDTVTPLDAIDDACAAFAWTRAHAEELGIDPERVAAHGVSAGGHLAASTATLGCPDGTRGADALALWSPALDVTHDGWFQRLLPEGVSAEDVSPAGHVGARTPPTGIVIGAEDTLTPLAGAEAFCDAATAAGSRCELFVYEGVGHLLTRNLENQESDFDPDPEKSADGIAKLDGFLAELGFVDAG